VTDKHTKGQTDRQTDHATSAGIDCIYAATLPGALTGFFPGESHRRQKGSVVGGAHGECGARAYNVGPGAEPLVRGSGGRSPLKLKAFWSLDVQWGRQI